MKHVILKTLHLVNWRKFNDFTANFGEVTTVSGDNEAGKSSMFDAFLWCLFGKDQFDRKDHEIAPVVDHEVMDKVDCEVTATIEVDGIDMVFRRILHPQWVRHSGKKDKDFEGYETRYFVNDVPCKMKEYNAKVDQIIDGTVFKMITNPAFFLNLKKEDQRNFLFTMAGAVSDETLAAGNEAFRALMDRITGKSIKEYKAEIRSKKSKLNDELSSIPSRIDQTKKLMPEGRDFGQAEAVKAEADQKIADIDVQIGDAVKANRAGYDAINGVNRQIAAKEDEGRRLVDAAQRAENDRVRKHNEDQDEKVRQSRKESDQARREIDDLRKELFYLQNNVARSENALQSKRQDLEMYKKDREALLARWKEASESCFKASDECLMCPVFKRPCTDSEAATHIIVAQEKARAAFEAEKAEKIEGINTRGRNIRQIIDSLTADIKTIEDQIAADKAKIESVQSQIAAKEEVLNGAAPVYKPEYLTAAKVDPATVAGWSDIQKEIESLRASIVDPSPVDTSDLQKEKAAWMARRDEAVAALKDRDTIQKHTDEIHALVEKMSEISQAIADLEAEEFLINDFMHAKVEECEKRINGMFTLVDWQLFDYTIDGNEMEACIPKNKKNGTPLSVTNTADKINCGLDIINTLCRYYGVTAPIFIDNRESVTNLIASESQIINLMKVAGQKELIITTN